MEDKKSIDISWILNFIDMASKICDADMKIIFSRILNGEINNPNKYSIRTLDVLKSLKPEEAKKIVELANYVFYTEKTDCFIISESEIVKNMTLGYLDLVELENANIIRTTDRRMYTESGQNFLFGNKMVYIYNKNEKPEISFKIYTFTEAGRDLYKLVEDKKYEEEYLKKLGEKYNFLIKTYDYKYNLDDETYDLRNEKII